MNRRTVSILIGLFFCQLQFGTTTAHSESTKQLSSDNKCPAPGIEGGTIEVNCRSLLTGVTRTVTVTSAGTLSATDGSFVCKLNCSVTDTPVYRSVASQANEPYVKLCGNGTWPLNDAAASCPTPSIQPAVRNGEAYAAGRCEEVSLDLAKLACKNAIPQVSTFPASTEEPKKSITFCCVATGSCTATPVSDPQSSSQRCVVSSDSCTEPYTRANPIYVDPNGSGGGGGGGEPGGGPPNCSGGTCGPSGCGGGIRYNAKNTSYGNEQGRCIDKVSTEHSSSASAEGRCYCSCSAKQPWFYGPF